jgi:enoyl-CoA hydratase/carnithine racemase
MTGSGNQTTPDYFNQFKSLEMVRDENGILIVTMNDGSGGPLTFGGQDHTDFTEAFYRIGRDYDNKVVILTGAVDFMASMDFDATLLEMMANSNIWARLFDEGVQIVENLANIRVPMIAAVEGKAHVHTEYVLMANIIVAGESATFSDTPHFAGGIVPGDGIHTTWAYRAGAGRAEHFLLNPQVISAQKAQDWGVVSEVVSDGKAVSRAVEIANNYLTKPEVTRRNTRILFVQPLKEALVRNTALGFSLEGASANALNQSFANTK